MYSLKFRVRVVAIATQPLHRLQIRPTGGHPLPTPKLHLDLDLGLGQGHISTYTIRIGLPACPTIWLYSLMHCWNIAVRISWNIDILRSLNSHDSFPKRKFENRAQTSYRLGVIKSLPTISFEFHAKTAEEIDLEKCNFRNFRSSVTLTLTLDQFEVTLVRISGRALPTHQIRAKSEKLFVDVRMDGRTQLPIVDQLGHRRGDDLNWLIGKLIDFEWP